MDTITPCRQTISERFPIATFVVRVPEDRHYEVACTTDPRLFHSNYAGNRTPENFYSSLSGGHMVARRGDNTWIMPPGQLKRFAGAPRLYYALGTYGGRNGALPRFTVSPEAPDEVPSIRLSPDFTGRSLDTCRFGSGRTGQLAYGAPAQTPLRWGGDFARAAELEVRAAAEQAREVPYDDGFDTALWRGLEESETAEPDDDYADDGDAMHDARPMMMTSVDEAVEYEDGPDAYQFTSAEDGEAYGHVARPLFAQQQDREALVREVVASGVPEADVRAFIEELTAPTEPAATQQVAESMAGDGTTVYLPGGTPLEGWKAAVFVAMMRAPLAANPVLAPLALVFPDGLFEICDRLNVTVAIGPSVAAGLGGGAGLGFGVFFAPGRLVGFYGSSATLLGWIGSASAALQLTVIHGGHERLRGEAHAASVTGDLSEGIGIGAKALWDPEGNFLGVTGELTLVAGVPVLSAVEVFAEHQQTEISVPAQSLDTSYGDTGAIDRNGVNGQVYGRPEGGVATAVPKAGQGKYPGYREYAVEESLAVGPASHPLGAVVLDIPEKVRILRVVGRADSGEDGYSAVSADSEYNDPSHPAYHDHHLGLSWGFIQFNQRSGALGRVLKRAKDREQALLPPSIPEAAIDPAHTFEALFGEHWQALLHTTDPQVTPMPDDRLAPVGGALLWEEPWLSRFRAAGAVPYFQAAQNEVAVVDYFDRILPVARWLGLNSARGLAMLLDRVVHAGFGGGLSWIMDAIGPIRSEADRANALQAVTGNPQDLAGFQRQMGLEPDGIWNAPTHAALTGALRTLGEASPIVVPGPGELLRSLLSAAKGSSFEHRLQALQGNSEDFDDNVSYDLG